MSICVILTKQHFVYWEKHILVIIQELAWLCKQYQAEIFTPSLLGKHSPSFPKIKWFIYEQTSPC